MQYSNCFIEAIKAKIKDPSVSIIFVSPFENDCFCPHFLWADRDRQFIYDYHSKELIRHWWQELWFKGYIRKRPYAAYARWRKFHTWK